MNPTGMECPYCGEQMFSIASYEHHVKTEHKDQTRVPHKHKHDIPVEWENFILWDGERRHPTDNIHPAFVVVTKLRCACGHEVER